MPRREHEAIAVGPDRVIRIEAQVLLPEAVGHGRQRHRRSGMPELACWTASIASVRIVLIDSVSSGSFAEETGCWTFRSEAMSLSTPRGS